MRICLTLCFFLFSFAAHAVDAPPGQVLLTTHDVLRGQFDEDRQMPNLDYPVHTSGHFVLAPANGLLWSIEQPFPTMSIITQDTILQTMGGMMMKLPVKNLRHLYDMVGGALRGDWNGLAVDYAIHQTGTSQHWQVLLTQRPGGKHSLTYTTITVSGGRFVENIAMMDAKGNIDTLNFTQEVLSAPLTTAEAAAFAKAAR